ncbi:single-stranded-DNA-specific exonuclease RecJ [Patescibacteria group bacterium]
MKTAWKLYPLKTLEQERTLDFPDLHARLLANRGICTDADIESYLHPKYDMLGDPGQMKGVDKAVAIIEKNLQEGSICIFGDYDADGITASSIYFETLERLGGDVQVILPTREEGYGLNSAAVEKIIEKKVSLLITADCGMRDAEQVEQLRKANIDVVVTDHHQAGEKEPDANVVVNPMRDGESYPFQRFSGAGVAFKVCQALLRCKKRDPIEEKRLLDLAALGTLADIMPLAGENRAMVKFGLEIMRIAKRPGLRVLFEHSGLSPKKASAQDIAFRIIPQLNAAGRIGDPITALKLLGSRNVSTAAEYSRTLQQVNETRKDLTHRAVEDISGHIDENAAVIFETSESWPRGITGLVAGKISDKYMKPTFVLEVTEKTAIGSVRGIDGLNVTHLLEKCSEHLEMYGGHEQAAGFTVKRNELDAFQSKIEETVQKLGVTEPKKEYQIDAETSFHQIDMKLIDFLSSLEPFGEANPEPIFMTNNCRIDDFRWVGKAKQHVQLFLSDGDGNPLKCIAFHRTDLKSIIKLENTIDIVYHVRENDWNGKRMVDAQLIDCKEIKR